MSQTQRTTLLFDLDGTLLPMDREEFTRAYLPAISAHGAAFAEPKALAAAIWGGCVDMMKATGPEETLEQVFWRGFTARCGLAQATVEECFEDYYRSPAFDALQNMTPAEPLAPAIVVAAKASGRRVVLATSPLFPRIATEKRIRWAGLNPEDFEHITTFEDYHAAKPHRQYFEELLARLGVTGEECVMIGNDAREDLPAPKALGMETFFVTNHAILPEGVTPQADYEGVYQDLLDYLRALPRL